MNFDPLPFLDIRFIALHIAKHIIEKWGRWSEIVAAKLRDIMSGSIAFANIWCRSYSIRMASYSGWS